MPKTVDRVDISEPYEEVATGVDDEGEELFDLAEVSGNELVGQRVQRVAMTEPGELRHRERFGAGLPRYASEPGTTSTQQAIIRDFDRALANLSMVDDHEVSIRVDAQGVFHVRPHVRVDGEELEVPEVKIE